MDEVRDLRSVFPVTDIELDESDDKGKLVVETGNDNPTIEKGVLVAWVGGVGDLIGSPEGLFPGMVMVFEDLVNLSLNEVDLDNAGFCCEEPCEEPEPCLEVRFPLPADPVKFEEGYVGFWRDERILGPLRCCDWVMRRGARGNDGLEACEGGVGETSETGLSLGTFPLVDSRGLGFGLEFDDLREADPLRGRGASKDVGRVGNEG